MRRAVVGLVCIAVCGGLFQPASAEPASGAASSDSATQVAPPSQVKNKPKMTCTTEKAMGSHIKRKTCRSQDDLERQRAESEHYMDDIRRGTSNNTGG